MARNMVQEFFGDLMILVHTAHAPNETEWKEYIEAVRASDLDKLKTLVFTDGGAPNAAQRKSVNEVLDGKTSPGAIVSHSMLVRGVVSALSWFNPKIKAFSPENTDAAFRYLGLPDEQAPAVWTVVHRLREKLGAPNLKCIAPPPDPSRQGPPVPLSR